LDALVPFLRLDGTAIDFEMNAVFFDGNAGDAGLIAGLHRWSPCDHEPLKVYATGRESTVLEGQTFLAHGKLGADVNQFRLEGADHFHAGVRVHARRRRRFLGGRLLIRSACAGHDQ